MTLNCTHTLVACGSSLLQKIINQQNRIHSFWPLLEFRHFRKIYSTTIYFCWWKIKFSASSRFWVQVLNKVLGVRRQTVTYNECKKIKTPHIHTKSYILGNFSGFRKWRNSISGRDKTEIFIYKVLFTLYSLVERIHNSTNAKEQKHRTSQCLQKRASTLILSLHEHKK